MYLKNYINNNDKHTYKPISIIIPLHEFQFAFHDKKIILYTYKNL